MNASCTERDPDRTPRRSDDGVRTAQRKGTRNQDGTWKRDEGEHQVAPALRRQGMRAAPLRQVIDQSSDHVPTKKAGDPQTEKHHFRAAPGPAIPERKFHGRDYRCRRQVDSLGPIEALRHFGESRRLKFAPVCQDVMLVMRNSGP